MEKQPLKSGYTTGTCAAAAAKAAAFFLLADVLPAHEIFGSTAVAEAMITNWHRQEESV